jgi:hypothetical protein
MLLMRIVWSFVWRKFASVGKGEWWDEMKDGQNLKLGDSHVTTRNIQEVQVSNLGDAQGTPFFIKKNIRSSFKTRYFYCFIWYVFFLERLYFWFQISFVLFAEINGWTQHISFGEDTLCFHCLEHSSFHSYRSTSVLFC